MNDNKTAIVTGGNRGIGKAIALRLAKENYNLIIYGRDEEALKKTQSEIKKLGVECKYFSGDAADENFVKESVAEIEKGFGKIDLLVNNAGMGIFKKLVDSELRDFKTQIDVNLYGIYNFSKAVLGGMIKHKSGAIINIASLAGKNSFPGGTMYSASKHAVLGFTRSLMLEVREYNIRVAAICPGSVATEFFGGTGRHPNYDKILKADDVAESVMAILKLPVHALISEVDLRPTNPK
ncbi:MAG TPA: SDR family NAD(P)-dependent oxidoreductase [Ignavibacteriaceae bacterium]|nr:SDR family NAD(P)-dependent oxidoreductase [Ignavibacteriaceae bacterium]